VGGEHARLHLVGQAAAHDKVCHCKTLSDLKVLDMELKK
jgi:hypothetical protein